MQSRGNYIDNVQVWSTQIIRNSFVSELSEIQPLVGAVFLPVWFTFIYLALCLEDWPNCLSQPAKHNANFLLYLPNLFTKYAGQDKWFLQLTRIYFSSFTMTSWTVSCTHIFIRGYAVSCLHIGELQSQLKLVFRVAGHGHRLWFKSLLLKKMCNSVALLFGYYR